MKIIDLNFDPFNFNDDIQYGRKPEPMHTLEAEEGESLRGLDLSNRQLGCFSITNKDLTGANFSSSLLDHSYLDNLILCDAVFTQAWGERISFHYSKLQNAKLDWVNFHRPSFSHADLTGVDFSYSNLEGANFRDAKLTNAKFIGTNILCAHITGAGDSSKFLNSIGYGFGDFNKADLTGVDFSHANLKGVSFNDAKLDNAIFTGADISDASFDKACLNGTVFTGCSTLGKAKLLENAFFDSPPIIDEQTFIYNVVQLPDVFLSALGHSRDKIIELRLCYGPLPRFYTCFLSYARLDKKFVDRLHRDLLSNGVECWIDVRDLEAGKKWRRQISEQIDKRERILLICSENSITRESVVGEIISAVQIEKEKGEEKLIPISLDQQITSPTMIQIGDEKVETGEWRLNWITYVQAYHILDFSSWRAGTKYDEAFGKLLRGLVRRK